MPDQQFGADDTAPPAGVDASASTDLPLPTGEGGGGALTEGGRWRTYQIGGQIGSSFIATDITAMEEVLLHSRPLGDRAGKRRAEWDRLNSVPPEGLMAPREAHEENGRRYEIYHMPVGMPLREWAAKRTLSAAELDAVVQQLTNTLDALHAAGVAHLHLHPQTIYVEVTRKGLRVQLGGLENVTLYDQTELIPVSVNPYWAPPEAAGLYQHKPGSGLCAWDWWTLGRILQELVMGSHVFGQMFGRDVTGEPFDLRARAENVLLERDASGVRAGAVEMLPAEVDARLRTVLRGLLTTVRDGRWRADEVRRWVQSGTGPDRYDLPRDSRLFWWRKRAYTVPEAAVHFLQPDNAFDGILQWFPAAQTADTPMRDFLAETPTLRAESDRVKQILGFVDTFPWQQYLLNARRSAVSGLAWRILAGPLDARLSVQRWSVDEMGMREMLSDAPPPEALAYARVLSLPAYRRAVEAVDAPAGRTLALMAENGFEALNQAVARNWIGAGDDDAHARLLWFAFESEAELLARRDRLRGAFATVRDAAIQALFAKERPTRTDLVLLAYLGENAARFGFVTQGEWSSERAAALRQGATHARAAIFWSRARRLLLCGQSLLGAWPIFLAIWIPAVAIVTAAGGWLWGVCLALLALFLRVAAWLLLRSIVKRLGYGNWRVADGMRRVQAAVVAAEAQLPEAARRNMVAAFNSAAADLRALAPRETIVAPPRMTLLWLLALLAQLVPLAICLGPLLGLNLARERDTTDYYRRPASHAISLGPNHELYEITNEGFGQRKRGPLKYWDVPAKEPIPLSVRALHPASPRQRAYARVGAELLLEPYPRWDLKLTLAVPVDFGPDAPVMLYDTESRELTDERAFELHEQPREKTWYWLGNRRVVYLGVPPRLPEVEKTLAQP